MNCLILALLLVTLSALAGPQRWSAKAADDWYAKQPRLVGSNYTPATAINELEMWQADTFDPKRIDLELGWAESLGMNTMSVFLHDLLWQQRHRPHPAEKCNRWFVVLVRERR
jgi:hypothetical protein